MMETSSNADVGSPARRGYVLLVLTALNLLNYADRNVLFAVQPLIQKDFDLTKEQIGFLTSAFLGFYMIAAPFVGPLADRYSRKLIIVLGAPAWSATALAAEVWTSTGIASASTQAPPAPGATSKTRRERANR